MSSQCAGGVILLSRDQPTIADPFPEQVAAVLLLVGYAVYALNRPHFAAAHAVR